MNTEPDLLDLVKREKERHDPHVRPLNRQQQEVYDVIRAGGARGVTTLDLKERCKQTCDPTRRARELKRLGLVQEPIYTGKSPAGSSIFTYRTQEASHGR